MKTMKLEISFLSLIASSFSLLVCAQTQSYMEGRLCAEVKNGISWTFIVLDEEAIVGTFTEAPAIPKNTSGAIVLPSRLGGYPVTKIGFEAFRACEGITSAKIPEGVTCIENNAFRDCKSLTSVSIPESIEEIGPWTFRDCQSLTAVTIPDSVTSIQHGAFCGCRKLSSITIPDSVTRVEYDAFRNCSGLRTLSIPASVTTIEQDAFRDSGLMEVFLPQRFKEKAKSIGIDSICKSRILIMS